MSKEQDRFERVLYGLLQEAYDRGLNKQAPIESIKDRAVTGLVPFCRLIADDQTLPENPYEKDKVPSLSNLANSLLPWERMQKAGQEVASKAYTEGVFRAVQAGFVKTLPLEASPCGIDPYPYCPK